MCFTLQVQQSCWWCAALLIAVATPSIAPAQTADKRFTQAVLPDRSTSSTTNGIGVDVIRF